MVKSNHKKLGIVFLIVSIIYLIFSSLSQMALLFIMWIVDFGQSKEAVSIFFKAIYLQPIYTQIVLFLTPINELIIFVWTFVLAILIIRNSKYISKIQYLFYFVFIKYLVFFVLYLPLKNYNEVITNLIVAIFIYFVLIWKNSFLYKSIYS